jgi:hypothetical protein
VLVDAELEGGFQVARPQASDSDGEGEDRILVQRRDQVVDDLAVGEPDALLDVAHEPLLGHEFSVVVRVVGHAEGAIRLLIGW